MSAYRQAEPRRIRTRMAGLDGYDHVIYPRRRRVSWTERCARAFDHAKFYLTRAGIITAFCISGLLSLGALVFVLWIVVRALGALLRGLGGLAVS